MKRFLLFMAFMLTVAPTFADVQELKFNTQDFAPFSYAIDGKVAGPAVDIIKKVCSEMNVKCSFKMLPWARAQKEVKSGNAHALFVIGWNTARTEWLHFSPPLLNTEYGFFVKDDNTLEYKQPSDIIGYKVGVYGPSNTSKSLDKIKDEIKDMTIDLWPDDEAGFKKLSKGRIDAVFSNREVGYELIKKNGLKNIRYSGHHKTLQYYIGFSKEFTDKNTVDKFNETFLELYKKGIIQGILEKYRMEPAIIK
jgi:polar amino acid transport system substrate-binding protein